MNGPFCEAGDAIGPIFVSLILLHSKFSNTFEANKVSIWRHQANALAKHDWLSGLSVFEFENEELFRFGDVHVFYLFAQLAMGSYLHITLDGVLKQMLCLPPD